MPSWIRTLALAVLCGAFLSSCAAGPQVIWPGSPRPGQVRYFYLPPDPPMPVDQAIGTLKNMQTRFCTWQGNSPDSLEVDRFGLRVRAAWTETTTGTNYVPNYGGFFVGNSYVPTYGGSYQPWQRTEGKEETAVVAFDKVTEVRLVFYGELNREYKWGLWFAMEGAPGGGEAFRFPDQAAALEFAAAASALIRAQGRDLSRDGQTGLDWADPTPAQIEDLAQTGRKAVKVIQWVYKDSPGEKAGIMVGDVIQSFIKAEGAPFGTFKGWRRGLVPDGKGGGTPGWTDIEIRVPFWKGTQAPSPAPGQPQPLARGMIGIDIGEVNPGAAQDLAQQGVTGGTEVRGVTPGSPAEGARILPGDVLLSVDGKPAAGPDQFKALVGGAGATLTIRGFRRGQVQDSSGRMVPAWTPLIFTLTRSGM